MTLRIRQETHMETREGLIALCDAEAVEPFLNDKCLSYSLPSRSYEIYAGNNFLVMNTAPDLLDPTCWADLVQVGELEISYSEWLILMDGSLLPEEEAENPHIFFFRFPFKDLTVWLEENQDHRNQISGETKKPFVFVLGIGMEPRLILAGPAATEVYRLEKWVARALRTRGKERQPRLRDVRAEIQKLQESGVKDDRLQRLAHLVGLKDDSREEKDPLEAWVNREYFTD